MQEFEAAQEAVLSVFPTASVVNNRMNSGPLEIKIVAFVGGEPTEIWNADQRGLFGKNGRRDVPKIQEALSTFKSALN